MKKVLVPSKLTVDNPAVQKRMDVMKEMPWVF